MGNIKTKPMPIVSKPGAINRNDTSATHHLSPIFSVANRYPVNATPRDPMPSIAPARVTVNTHQVNPSATNRSAGEQTNCIHCLSKAAPGWCRLSPRSLSHRIGLATSPLVLNWPEKVYLTGIDVAKVVYV